MKDNVIYSSMYSDRQWKKVNGVLMTRDPGSIWREAGWPQPDMTERDVDYYISTGAFIERDGD